MTTAPGFHLFPFRTEKLSPVTPMVLRNSGRVGSRRFTEESPVSDIGTGDLLFGDLMLDLNAETDMPSERELLRFNMYLDGGMDWFSCFQP